MNYSETTTRTGRLLIGLAGLLLAASAAFLPGAAQAQDICDIALSAGDTSTTDTDGDGFTDWQECTGITTVGATPVLFPRCGLPLLDGTLPARDRCMDPASRDVFAILRLPTTGSLLPAVQSPGSATPYNPFQPYSVYGVNFTGLEALSLAVHKLSPGEAATDRTVTGAVAGLAAPKALMVTESLDPNGTILGNCQYGLPSGLDGCVFYTARTQATIASICGSAAIQTPSGTAATPQDVLWAYSTYIALHESGHSLGGLTGEYNSRFGGYHYKPGSNLIMDQTVTYTVKGGKCTFYIPSTWNVTLDPPAVRLK
jgi:hypothetical protein